MTEVIARESLGASELEDLHARYRRPLISYFLRRVGNLAEAEDLTQEVFFRLHRRSSETRIEHRGGFIFTAATNLLRDRARQRQVRALERNGEAHAAPTVEECTPDRVLLGKERLAEVLACLDELSPRTRDAFLLFRLERMKQRDIAAALGISVSAVEKHIVRAVAHLAERFASASSRSDEHGA